jgi:hypothetical protein
MTSRFLLACVLLAATCCAGGCMTPGYQYLAPPGFSSTAVKASAVAYDPSWRTGGKTW